MITPLRELVSPTYANIVTESADNGRGGKDLYMRGIFIQGGVRNQNQRVYPVNEISRAVKSLKEKLSNGYSVLGEADHPEDLNINLDRVSHMIVDMEMNGNDGIGKLKMLPTPMGNVCKTLLESGVKLGVSSRGSGDVDHSGNVSGFEIITVDIVANPSAPDAYPKPIYENLMNHRRSNVIWDVASSVRYDTKAQRYLQEEIVKFITDLGRK
jgi:hypothetical protein